MNEYAYPLYVVPMSKEATRGFGLMLSLEKESRNFYCLANVIKQITTQLTKVFNQSFLRELQLNNYLTG